MITDRCPLCPGKYKCTKPIGPTKPGGLAFIGEANGWQEERKDEPFVGPTGREVNEGYFPICGIRRPDVWIGNAIRCLPDTPQNKLDLKKEKHRELLESCSSHFLHPSLEHIKPRLIIPMGAFACHAISPDIDLELQHGIPIETSYGTAFPMYHPAGGIHEPKKMLHIRTDWARLRKYLRGTLDIAYDEYEGAEDYTEIDDPYEINEDMSGMQDLPLACDTENARDGTPFCLTYSVFPGRARLIRATNLAALEHLQRFLNEWEGPILWHNWLHDNKITDRMGLRFPRRRIVDTMVRVFELGNLPQGLKALSYRELGMKMLDFDDLVSPHSAKIVLSYLREAMSYDWPKPPKESTRQADGSIKDKQPQSMRSKIKRFLTAVGKDPDKNVFDAWDNWEESHELIEETIGRYPSKCITHAAEADWELTKWYACLSKRSKVSTPNGYMDIGDIVRDRYTGEVYTYNLKTNSIETRPVIAHYRIQHTEPVQWMSIETSHTRIGKWGNIGTRYTPDHKVLTPEGYKRVDVLRQRDQIYLPVGELNSIEWQVVYGSLLGDGTVSKRNSGGWCNLRVTHNERQKPYLYWKASLLTNLNPNIALIPARSKIINDRETNSGCNHYGFATIQHPELVSVRKESYIIPGYKNVGAWINKLDQLGLSIWYQDDGTLVSGRYPRLYTLGFVKDDVDTLRAMLTARFGLESNCYETAREGQWAISIPASSCDRFFGLIAANVHPCMQYKLPNDWLSCYTPAKALPPKGLVLSSVDRVYTNPSTPGRTGEVYQSYCIDVKETHNFLTMGEIAHNCRDADALRRFWPVLRHMERQVRHRPQESWRDTAQ